MANKIGQMLIDNHEITKEQLDQALEIQEHTGGLVGVILIQNKIISEETLVKYLTYQTQSFITDARNKSNK